MLFFLYILLFILFLIPTLIAMSYLIAGINLIFQGNKENKETKIKSGKYTVLYSSISLLIIVAAGIFIFKTLS